MFSMPPPRFYSRGYGIHLVTHPSAGRTFVSQTRNSCCPLFFCSVEFFLDDLSCLSRLTPTYTETIVHHAFYLVEFFLTLSVRATLKNLHAKAGI